MRTFRQRALLDRKRTICFLTLVTVCVWLMPLSATSTQRGRGGGGFGGFGGGGGGFGGNSDITRPLGPSLQPVAESREELNAYQSLVEEPEPGQRLVLSDEFLQVYPESELRHLVLKARWEVVVRTADAAGVISAAEAASEAEIDFFESRSGAIPNPRIIPGFGIFEFAHFDAVTGYYRSMMAAYGQLNDWDSVADVGELAFEAEDSSWESYVRIVEEGTEEYQSAFEAHQATRLGTLQTMMAARESVNDSAGTIGYAERVLELEPDDLPTLITIAGAMAQRPFGPDEDLDGYMETAEAYARRAIDNLDRLLASAAATQIGEDQRASLQSRVHATLGLVLSRRQDYAAAEAEYLQALEAIPDDAVTYFRLGVILVSGGRAEDSLSPLARAVALNAPFAAAVETLERIYEAVYGSLDGMEEFVQSEGLAVPLP